MLGLWPVVIGCLMGIPQVATSVEFNAWVGRSWLQSSGLTLAGSRADFGYSL